MKDQFKKFAAKAREIKDSKAVKGALAKKGVIVGAVLNAGTTAYTFRKAGPKAALAVGAASLAWSVASAALFRSWDKQEEEEKTEAERQEREARSGEAVESAFPPKKKGQAGGRPAAEQSSDGGNEGGAAKTPKARRTRKDPPAPGAGPA